MTYLYFTSQQSEYDVNDSEVDSQDLLHGIEEDYHYNDDDYDNNKNNDVTLSSYHYGNDVVVRDEVTSEGYEGCEGYEVVMNEGEEVKDDDVDSVDFLFNEDHEDDDHDDEALHLPPHSTSHDIVEDDDVSLSDLFLNEEEEEKE